MLSAHTRFPGVSRACKRSISRGIGGKNNVSFVAAEFSIVMWYTKGVGIAVVLAAEGGYDFFKHKRVFVCFIVYFVHRRTINSRHLAFDQLIK